MQISFTTDQQALRESMRGFFSSRSSLAALRRDPQDVPGLPDYWPEMARLDLLEVGSARADGPSLVDLLPVYLEMGRALSLSPHLDTAVLAAGAIAALDPAADILDGIAAGTAIVVAALRDAEGELQLDHPGVVASESAEGWSLRGAATLVPFAQVATDLLVPARTPEGVCLFLVPAAAPGVTRSLLPNIAGLPLYLVEFGRDGSDGVVVAATGRLGDPAASGTALGAALDRAAVLRCAEIAGTGERLLELCVDYARTREQFGRPIGSFQAVQYLCTDIAIASRVTLLLAAQAGGRIDQGREYRAELAAARRYAKQAAAVIVGAAHEVHAGVGFMDEHDLHLFTRRSRYWDFDLDAAADGAAAQLDRYAPGTNRGEV